MDHHDDHAEGVNRHSGLNGLEWDCKQVFCDLECSGMGAPRWYLDFRPSSSWHLLFKLGSTPGMVTNMCRP